MFFVPPLNRIESNRIESNIGLVESNRFRIVNFRNDAESNRVEYNLDRIESNRIESNRFEIFKNLVESNRIEYSFSRIESNSNGVFFVLFGLCTLPPIPIRVLILLHT